MVILCSMAGVCYGQLVPDSISQKPHAVSKATGEALQPLPDSLLASFQKLDSIRTTFNLAADSIRTVYGKSLRNIDAETIKLHGVIDSLRMLRLPTAQYTKRLDSLDIFVKRPSYSSIQS